MLRILLSGFAVLGLGLALVSQTSQAQGEKGKKEVTLKGKITCAKCDLGVATACETVIVVTKDKKDITYWFDAKGHKEHHATICSESKAGSVVGVVSKDGKKDIVTVKKVNFE